MNVNHQQEPLSNNRKTRPKLATSLTHGCRRGVSKKGCLTNEDGKNVAYGRDSGSIPCGLGNPAYFLNERWQGGAEAFPGGPHPPGWRFEHPGTECNWPDTVRVRKEPYVFTYTYSWGTVNFPGEWVSIDLR